MSKSWDRPWSTDEIIENSDDWSLAGDVALLHTLKAFADNLLTRTSDINNKLQSLTNSLDETSLQLDIAQNEFQGLRNTQFIESRVYEDDESLPVNEEKKVDEKKSDHCEEIRLAAVKGLEVLEEYFEKVEVSVSDSEDEDIDLPNYVLRPKDLYIHRPLPYVIGSADWHKTWHVGLEDSSSDSETEKVSDKFSESDSESELPIIQDRSQIKGTSDTSSEFDFSQKTESKLNIPNSSDSDNSVPIQGPISNSNFAEQLAAKLGHVITEYQEPEVNTRPIVQQPQKSHYGDMFFDEPPPLDEPKGLFSGGGGLFDDDVPSPKTAKTGLFDGGDSDDDFFPKDSAPEKKTLFPEEPPQIDVKKPVGGVSILGGGNLFDKKLLRRQPSSESEEEAEVKKKVDLFGDDDLFSAQKKVENKKKVNLFDSEEEDASLFVEPEKTPEEKSEESTKEPKKVSLFDDDDDLFKDDLFSSNTKKSFTSGLFDDIPGEDLFEEKSKVSSGNLFDDLVAIPDKNSINVDAPSAPQPKPFFSLSPKKNSEDISKPQLSLFDSPPPEPDDLFASKNSPDDSPDLFDQIPSSTPQNTPSLRLFDPNPPPDDEWDTKSDKLSENDDFSNDFEEPKDKTSLFSEEPPSLDPKPETSRPKPGKLKHNLNINVGALIPGYVPRKRTEASDTSPKSLPATLPDFYPASKPGVAATSPTVSFDETDDVKVLHSVTKDRARVPLKRRPSTRKGRQAALRNSVSDFKLPQENQEAEKSEEKPVPSEGLFVEKEENDGLFGGAKNDDLFGESLTKSLPKAGDLFAENVPNDDLFSLSKNDLFDAPKVSGKPSRDDDLFATKVPKIDDLFATSKSVPKPDERVPENDDLFATSQNVPESDDLFATSSNLARNLPKNVEKVPESDDLFATSTILTRNVPKSDEKVPESDDLFASKPDLTKNVPESDNLFATSPNLTKSDDLFASTQNLTKNVPKSDSLFSRESVTENIPKMDERLLETEDLFATSGQPKTDDLFGSPEKSKSEEKVKKAVKPETVSKGGLFDDDDDDGLFSAKKTTKSAKSKKSLFDDNEDDDDDIFKNFSTAGVKKTESKIATEKKIPKVSSVKKLENTKPDDDPLSALLK